MTRQVIKRPRVKLQDSLEKEVRKTLNRKEVEEICSRLNQTFGLDFQIPTDQETMYHWTDAGRDTWLISSNKLQAVKNSNDEEIINDTETMTMALEDYLLMEEGIDDVYVGGRSGYRTGNVFIQKSNSIESKKVGRSVIKNRSEIMIESNRSVKKNFTSIGSSSQDSLDSSTTYKMAASYLGCQIKELCQNSTLVPTTKMGSFLTGLKHALADYRLVDIRNIRDTGERFGNVGKDAEAPPVYETLQLNSKSRDSFLVQGTAFFEGIIPVKRGYPLQLAKEVKKGLGRSVTKSQRSNKPYKQVTKMFSVDPDDIRSMVIDEDWSGLKNYLIQAYESVANANLVYADTGPIDADQEVQFLRRVYNEGGPDELNAAIQDLTWRLNSNLPGEEFDFEVKSLRKSGLNDARLAWQIEAVVDVIEGHTGDDIRELYENLIDWNCESITGTATNVEEMREELIHAVRTGDPTVLYFTINTNLPDYTPEQMREGDEERPGDPSYVEDFTEDEYYPYGKSINKAGLNDQRVQQRMRLVIDDLYNELNENGDDSEEIVSDYMNTIAGEAQTAEQMVHEIEQAILRGDRRICRYFNIFLNQQDATPDIMRTRDPEYVEDFTEDEYHPYGKSINKAGLNDTRVADRVDSIIAGLHQALDTDIGQETIRIYYDALQDDLHEGGPIVSGQAETVEEMAREMEDQLSAGNRAIYRFFDINLGQPDPEKPPSEYVEEFPEYTPNPSLKAIRKAGPNDARIQEAVEHAIQVVENAPLFGAVWDEYVEGQWEPANEGQAPPGIVDIWYNIDSVPIGVGPENIDDPETVQFLEDLRQDIIQGLRSLRPEYLRAFGIDEDLPDPEQLPPEYVEDLPEYIPDIPLKNRESVTKGSGPHNIMGRTTGERFIVKCEPTWGGLNVTIFTHVTSAPLNQSIIDRAWVWAKENNFLKNEAFALSGEFLSRSNDTWDNIFLEPHNKESVDRVLKLFNSKGKDFANRGIILTGPPGSGKTTTGRMLKDQAKGTFIWVSSRDFHEAGSVGGLSAAFEMAKELAPAIIFMEDVDNWLTPTTIDLLKTEMDGISRSSGVLTILTTNFPERLPDALIDRPGRFHDVLNFDLPSKECRKQMLLKWLPQEPIQKSITQVEK